MDFVDTELMKPIRGDCLSQQFEVEGDVWPTGLPPLCGRLDDQHCKPVLVGVDFSLHHDQNFLSYFSLSSSGTLDIECYGC